MHLKNHNLALVILTTYSLYVNASYTIIESRLVVTFHTRELAAQDYVVPNTTIVRQYGRRLILDFGRPVDIDVDTETITNAIDQSLVVSIEIDSIASTTAISQWPLLDSETYSIKPQQAWARTKGSSDVIIAVLDTGLQTLGSQNFKNYKAGYDFVNRDADPVDDGSAGCDALHGTYVANILAFNHDLSVGYKGVAPDCSVQILKVLNSCGSGYATDVSSAIWYASGSNVAGVGTNPTPVKVISMSLNGKSSCPSYLQAAVDYAVSLGVIVVSSAGNNADDASYYWPANCNGVIVVAASRRDGYRASYSNYGSRVNVAAPGGDGYDQVPLIRFSGGSYILTYGIGTSYATPMVSGVLALWVSWLKLLKVAETNLVSSISRNTVPGYCSQCGPGIINTYINYVQSTHLSRASIETVWDNSSRVMSQMGKHCWLQGCYVLSDCCWNCVTSCAITNKEFSYYDCKVGKDGNSLCSPVCEKTMCASGSYYTQCTMGTSKALTATCSACTTCTAGYFGTSVCYDMGNTQCSPCTVCTSGQSITSSCKAFNDTICTDCSPGKYSLISSNYGNTPGCVACNTGYFATEPRSTTCSRCTAPSEPNMYLSGCGGGTGGKTLTCTTCPPGKFKSVSCTSFSDSTCTDCSSGFYSAQSGVTACSPCTLTSTIGTFKKDCGGSSPGSEANCSNVK